MAVYADVKRQILERAYGDASTEDNPNLNVIAEFIMQMSRIDFNYSMMLLKDNLGRHPEDLHDKRGRLANSVISYALEQNHLETIHYIILDRELAEDLFRECGQHIESFGEVVKYCLVDGNLEDAADFLEMARSNTYTCTGFSDFLAETIPENIDSLSDSARELISGWCARALEDLEADNRQLQEKLTRVFARPEAPIPHV